MNPKHWLRIPIFALAFALGGCGINALTIQSASDVNVASQAVVTQAKAALDDASVRRERAYATLIASDTSCPLADPVKILVPMGPPRPGSPPAPLCWDPSPPAPEPAGYRVEEISFAPISNEALKPTLTLIGAVADYGDALAKIAGEPKPDVAKELEGIISKVNDVKTIATGLAGLKIPDISALGKEQLSTATNLAQFIAELVDEARRVKDIRAVVRKHEDKLPGIIEQLRGQIGIWQTIVAKGYAQVTTNNVARAYSEAERKRMSFDERTAMVTLFRQTQRDANAVPILAAAFNRALDHFIEANTELRNLLDGKPTPEQRAEADRITADRILKGLKLVSEAVTAWGGIF